MASWWDYRENQAVLASYIREYLASDTREEEEPSIRQWTEVMGSCEPSELFELIRDTRALYNGPTLLESAAERNHRNVLKAVHKILESSQWFELLAAKSRRKPHRTILHILCHNGHYDMINSVKDTLKSEEKVKLFTMKDSNEETPLLTACRRGHHRLVKSLDVISKLDAERSQRLVDSTSAVFDQDSISVKRAELKSPEEQTVAGLFRYFTTEHRARLSRYETFALAFDISTSLALSVLQNASSEQWLMVLSSQDEHGKTPSHLACHVNDFMWIEDVMQSLAPDDILTLLTLCDKENRSIFHLAVATGSGNLLEYFLSHISFLFSSASNNSQQKTSKKKWTDLLKCRTSDGQTAMHLVIDNFGEEEVSKSLHFLDMEDILSILESTSSVKRCFGVTNLWLHHYLAEESVLQYIVNNKWDNALFELIREKFENKKASMDKLNSYIMNADSPNQMVIALFVLKVIYEAGFDDYSGLFDLLEQRNQNGECILHFAADHSSLDELTRFFSVTAKLVKQSGNGKRWASLLLMTDDSDDAVLKKLLLVNSSPGFVGLLFDAMATLDILEMLQFQDHDDKITTLHRIPHDLLPNILLHVNQSIRVDTYDVWMELLCRPNMHSDPVIHLLVEARAFKVVATILKRLTHTDKIKVLSLKDKSKQTTLHKMVSLNTTTNHLPYVLSQLHLHEGRGQDEEYYRLWAELFCLQDSSTDTVFHKANKVSLGILLEMLCQIYENTENCIRAPHLAKHCEHILCITNSKGVTPLHKAFQSRDPELISRVLKLFSKTKTPELIQKISDNKENSVLHMLADRSFDQNIEVMDILSLVMQAMRADISKQRWFHVISKPNSNGDTAVHLLANRCFTSSLSMILESLGSGYLSQLLKIQNRGGDTILHLSFKCYMDRNQPQQFGNSKTKEDGCPVCRKYSFGPFESHLLMGASCQSCRTRRSAQCSVDVVLKSLTRVNKRQIYTLLQIQDKNQLSPLCFVTVPSILLDILSKVGEHNIRKLLCKEEFGFPMLEQAVKFSDTRSLEFCLSTIKDTAADTNWLHSKIQTLYRIGNSFSCPMLMEMYTEKTFRKILKEEKDVENLINNGWPDMTHIDALSPPHLSSKYLIPHHQKKVKQYGMILYNRHNRKGALDEANRLASSLQDSGFQTTVNEWSDASRELGDRISENLDTIYADCSLLFACIMAHGTMGVLRGDNSSDVAINDLLYYFSHSKLPAHIPMIIVIQACQSAKMVATGSMQAGAVDAARVDPADKKHIILTRPHTLLLLATTRGGNAVRGAYTGALANQIRKADGKTDMFSMHTTAVNEMKSKDPKTHNQHPEMRSTLAKDLVLPAQPSQPGSEKRTSLVSGISLLREALEDA